VKYSPTEIQNPKPKRAKIVVPKIIKLDFGITLYFTISGSL
jgi:hypothetical protein